jgi:hypothetical protein
MKSIQQKYVVFERMKATCHYPVLKYILKLGKDHKKYFLL